MVDGLVRSHFQYLKNEFGGKSTGQEGFVVTQQMTWQNAAGTEQHKTGQTA